MNSTFFSELLQAIAERGRSLLEPKTLAGEKRGVVELAEELLSSAGEASAIALAERIIAAFEALDDEGRGAVFQALAEQFGAEPRRLQLAIQRYQDNPSEENALELHDAAEPRRQQLIRRLNLAPNGTAALVRIRADLLGRLRSNPALRTVDSDFLHLFSSWFNRGFLVIRPIDWSTSAAVLERIIRYEAVHEINDWEDLRRRIDMPDRRCFAFFHPALVDEPLIFVEVALTRGVPEAIAPILDQDREPIEAEEADTAVFYSISNCQKGLKGVSFGSFLIKQVVADLVSKGDLPKLANFVTLSPVPGFKGWLDGALAAAREEGRSDLDPSIEDLLRRPDWPEDPEAAEQLKRLLMPEAARYFLKEKHKGRPVDPVARFHLGNGASLERINWLGDPSPKGLRQAAGFMVNYRYDIAEIERNHEAYANEGRVVAAPKVQKLLRPDSTGNKR